MSGSDEAASEIPEELVKVHFLREIAQYRKGDVVDFTREQSRYLILAGFAEICEDTSNED